MGYTLRFSQSDFAQTAYCVLPDPFGRQAQNVFRCNLFYNRYFSYIMLVLPWLLFVSLVAQISSLFIINKAAPKDVTSMTLRISSGKALSEWFDEQCTPTNQGFMKKTMKKIGSDSQSITSDDSQVTDAS